MYTPEGAADAWSCCRMPVSLGTLVGLGGEIDKGWFRWILPWPLGVWADLLLPGLGTLGVDVTDLSELSERCKGSAMEVTLFVMAILSVVAACLVGFLDWGADACALIIVVLGLAPPWGAREGANAPFWILKSSAPEDLAWCPGAVCLGLWVNVFVAGKLQLVCLEVFCPACSCLECGLLLSFHVLAAALCWWEQFLAPQGA